MILIPDYRHIIVSICLIITGIMRDTPNDRFQFPIHDQIIWIYIKYENHRKGDSCRTRSMDVKPDEYSWRKEYVLEFVNLCFIVRMYHAWRHDMKRLKWNTRLFQYQFTHRRDNNKKYAKFISSCKIDASESSFVRSST